MSEPESRAPADGAGATFGRYRLVERIGEGGMAVVWRAVATGPKDVGFERQVVIKRILPRLNKLPQLTRMLLDEARLCGRMHHPAIAQVTDVGEVGGEYFMAMEWVDGWDLASVLTRCRELERAVPAGLACFIAAELAGALAYAHALTGADGKSLELVHRDVSPSNVMLTPLGAVKLLDFGVARIKRAVPEERTRTGTLKGKVAYMSPEQAEGLPIDRRTDVFALGVVLHECLTGERLFRGDDELETLRRVREARVWPPSEARPEISPDVDAVVMRMLQRTVEARFQSCDEAARALAPLVHAHHADAGALKQFLDELQPIRSEALTVGEGRDTTAPAKQSARRSQAVESRAPTVDARPRRRARVAIGALSALALAGAAIVLAVVLGGRGAGSIARAPDGGAGERRGPDEQKRDDSHDTVIGSSSPQPIDRAHGGRRRVALVPLKNLTGDASLDFFGEGSSDTAATRLGVRRDLVLIERNQIDKGLRELDFGRTRYADPKLAAQLGRVVGAEWVVIGSYQRERDQLYVTARIVDVASSIVVDTVEWRGASGALLDAQQTFARELERVLAARIANK
jgi:serine/threonine-protein kinase